MTMHWMIGDWVVQQDANRLTKGDYNVRLEPKAMAVLCHLAANAGTTVSREELEAVCWAGQVVGYDALSNSVIKIRKALRDDARNPKFVETIPRTGYRLIAEITNAPSESRKSLAAVDAESSTARRLTRPAIVVLPLRPGKQANGSLDTARFAGEVLSEDILIALSRQVGCSVISRNSAFHYRDEPDFKQIASELAVDFVIDGLIVDDGQGFDVRVALNTCDQSKVVWAERYKIDKAITPVALNLAVSSVVGSVLTSLGLTQQKTAVGANRGTQNETAYSHFLKGRELDRQDTQQSNVAAREQFRLAIEYDSKFSSAYSYLSRSMAVCYINRWSDFHTEQLRDALKNAQTAIDLDKKNPHGYFAQAASILWLRDHQSALQSADEALRLDPDFAEAHAVKGMIHLYDGVPFKALQPLQNAMLLDPHFRDAYQHIQAQAYFHLGEFEKAESLLLQRILRKPESDTSRVLLAATYGYLGHSNTAKEQWERVKVINPEYSIAHKKSILPFRIPEHFDQIVEGLRRAGIPVDDNQK